MMKKSFVTQIAKYVALILLGMLISTSALASNTTGKSAPSTEASAASRDVVAGTQHISSPASPTSEISIFCTPVGVMTFENESGFPRLHVQCAAAVGGIRYFAASTANAARAARILSTISAAQIAGRTLIIRYDPDDTSGTAIGCNESDCRLILAVGFGQ